tara:strand:+ start:122 stop:475 length:354 start_codon:yes stop_codon:yes gene_type:complete
MSKIDTQGMSAPLSPEEAAKYKNKPQKHKPWVVKPNRLFTETYAREMKILINEVLDEREYNKRMAGPYDHVKPLPPSYFDIEHFTYYVGEEEPPYQDWSQPSFEVGLSPEYKPGYYQ